MKTRVFKLFIISCLLFLGAQSAKAATLTVGSVTTTAGSNGLAASPLNVNQIGIAVIGISTRSSTGTLNITSFAFSGSSAISANFSNFKLYKSTNTTYTSGTDPIVTGATASVSGTNLTFTFPTQAITTTTVYYFVVADYTAPVNSSNFQFTVTGVTGATATGLPASGPNYTLAPPITLGATLTTGLATSPMDNSATAQAILGFSINTLANFTFTKFNLSSTQPTGTIGTYFSNFKIYSCTTNNYSTGAKTLITGVTFSALNSTTLTISGLSQAINSTTKYYFIVADYNAPVTSTTFQLSLNSVSTAANTYSYGADIDGINYTLSPPVTLGTATTTGLASGTLSQNTAGIGILGFSITTGDNETITSLQMSANLTIGTYFSNFKLYRNKTQNKYTGTGGATQVTGVTFSNLNSTTITITGLSDAINTTTWYYFIVADYTVASSTSVLFQLNATTASTASASYTNGGIITGSALTLGADVVNWTGGTSTDWNTASNWNENHVPGPYDVVQLYMDYEPSPSNNNSPKISAPGNYTVAELDFGGWFASQGGVYWPGLNLVSGVNLTVTNNITYNPDSHPGLVPTSIIPGNNSNLYVMQGSGTIKCTNLVVDSRYGPLLTTDDTQQAVVSYFSSFTVTGDVNLYSENYTTTRNGTSNQVSTFYLLSGIMEIDGNINTSNVTAGSSNVTTNLNSTFRIAPASSSGATLIIKGANIFSSLSTIGNTALSFNLNYSNVIYSGANQTIYTNVIPGASGGVTYYNLTLDGTGAKTPNTGSGTLSISNNFTNLLNNDASEYVTLTGTPVAFTGTTQTLAGGLGTGTTFGTVTFSGLGTKTMASGYFNVAPTGLLTMSGTSTSTSLNADGGGLLTLQSDANNSASIGVIAETGVTQGPSIIGNVNVQRYLTGGNVKYRGYRLLSAPVNISSSSSGTGNASLKYVNSDVTLPAVQYGALTGGAAGGGFTVSNGNPTMYLYNESILTNNSSFTSGKNVGISAVTATGVSTLSKGVAGTATIPVGTGYFLYFIGNDQSLVTASSRVPENTVLTAKGYVNQGDVIFKLWNNSSTSLSWTSAYGVNAGYNLVGNPYASMIDLKKVSSENGSKFVTFAILNDVNPNQGFGYYNAGTGGTSGVGSEYVASGQGFFVQATATGQSLTFKEDQKVYNTALLTSTSTIPGVLTAPNRKNITAALVKNDAMVQPKDILTGLHLKLQKDDYVDECGIYFSDKWLDNYDTNDASIIGGSGKISMYSFTREGYPVGINSLADYKKGKRIKLFVKSALSGVYNLSLDDITNVDTILYNVYLVDKLHNDSLDIVRYKSYAFDLNAADTTTFGANRFVLAVERKPLPPYQLISFTGQKVTGGVQVNWKTYNEGNFTGFVLQKQGANKQFTALQSLQSSGATNYSYVDHSPLNGSNVYRLQQNDIDGNITYSAPVTVAYNSSTATQSIFTIYPNPATELITVNLTSITKKSASYTSNIYNTAGEIVGHRIVSGDSWTEDVTGYKIGTYIIELKGVDGSFIGKSKFVKTN